MTPGGSLLLRGEPRRLHELVKVKGLRCVCVEQLKAPCIGSNRRGQCNQNPGGERSAVLDGQTNRHELVFWTCLEAAECFRKEFCEHLKEDHDSLYERQKDLSREREKDRHKCTSMRVGGALENEAKARTERPERIGRKVMT